MKKLVVALMVLASLASCGKNNAVGTAATTAMNGLTVTTPSATSLGSAITNYTSAFGGGLTGSTGSNLTWNQLIVNQPNITYYYYKAAAVASNCTTKWSIFTVCSTSSSSSSSTLSRTVVNSSVNITTKQNELIAILNKSSSIQQNGTSFYIYTTDAKLYIIDTRFPLQANPVQTQDASSVEVFTNAI